MSRNVNGTVINAARSPTQTTSKRAKGGNVRAIAEIRHSDVFVTLFKERPCRRKIFLDIYVMFFIERLRQYNFRVLVLDMYKNNLTVIIVNSYKESINYKN